MRCSHCHWVITQNQSVPAALKQISIGSATGSSTSRGVAYYHFDIGTLFVYIETPWKIHSFTHKAWPLKTLTATQTLSLKLAYQGAVRTKPLRYFISSVFFESVVPCLIAEWMLIRDTNRSEIREPELCVCPGDAGKRIPGGGLGTVFRKGRWQSCWALSSQEILLIFLYFSWHTYFLPKEQLNSNDVIF